jgi:hypothetical protein
VKTRSEEQHLEPGDVAAYVDTALHGPARRAVESHLAACAQCRAEVIDVGGVIRTMPRSRQRRYWIPAAAAAAVLLLWVAPPIDQDAPVIHRDESVTLTPAPRPLAATTADAAPMAAWSPVPTADRYRARLFNAAGMVLWERETTDTIAVVPDSIALQVGTPHFWKVESHSGFGRWSASELVEFVPRRDRDR